GRVDVPEGDRDLHGPVLALSETAPLRPGRRGRHRRRSLSVNLLPFRRGQDAHQLAVLGNRPAGDVDLRLAEELGDVLVRERFPGVLLGDYYPDLLLDALRRHLGALPPAQARGEEVLELEGPLRRVHVLARGGAAHGRLVHADVVGDVLQHERAQEGDAAAEEVALELHDARGDHVERALPLVDRLDEPGGGPHLLLDVAARFRRAVLPYYSALAVLHVRW